VVEKPSDLAARPNHQYSLQNVMYLAKSVKTTRAGFDKYGALSITADEARCSASQVMAGFVTTPISSDISFGFLAPLQINSEFYIDLDARAIDVRIADALGREVVGTPQSDDLVATWHSCLSLDNVLKSTLGIGLLHFQQPSLELGEEVQHWLPAGSLCPGTFLATS
jgi:hypothetical protein